MAQKVAINDTTQRDGTQAENFNLSAMSPNAANSNGKRG